MSYYDDIKAFHKKFALEYNGPPRGLPAELEGFRSRFMGEELVEYLSTSDTDKKFFLRAINAIRDFNNAIGGSTPELDKKLDALVDLTYVVLGTAYLHGFDFDEAWRRVHEANMKKIRATLSEQSARGSVFDVVKPSGWTPPNLSDLVCPFGGKQTGVDLDGKPLVGDQL